LKWVNSREIEREYSQSKGELGHESHPFRSFVGCPDERRGVACKANRSSPQADSFVSISELSKPQFLKKSPAKIVGMGQPTEQPVGETEKLRRHLMTHGLIAMAITAFSLFAMRGFDVRALLVFGFPTAVAFVHARTGKSPVAEAFLICIGVASVIALIPALFPHLGIGFGAIDPRNHNNRLATIYCIIYFTWIFVVLPIHFFVGGLLARRRGRPAVVSRFTCILGVCAIGLVWPAILTMLPKIVHRVGLWPIF
jgi:hypothetical protein